MTWQTAIEEWVKSKRKIPNELTQEYIRLFELAFQNTLISEKAWFGVHQSSASLVVGQIYLLGVTTDGIWLLLDRKLKDDRIHYKVVKSTKDLPIPLIWAKVDNLQNVELLTKNPDIWDSYSLASQKITEVWVSGSRDDDFQKKKDKFKLSDFWQNSLQDHYLSSSMLAEYAKADECGDFDPTSIEDARQRQIRAIVQRRGQARFRQELMKIHDSRCQITDCAVSDVLEAAHIIPYQGSETNHIRNGLLLRSDLHILFDLYLIAIKPETYEIVLSRKLHDSTYEEFSGKILRLPLNPNIIPDAAIETHYEKFLDKNH
jgi:putative restriction endonuclease